MFSATFMEKYLFLKLMYRVINQKEFKHKLLRFPLNCHLEKELRPILNGHISKEHRFGSYRSQAHTTRNSKRHGFIN